MSGIISVPMAKPRLCASSAAMVISELRIYLDVAQRLARFRTVTDSWASGGLHTLQVCQTTPYFNWIQAHALPMVVDAERATQCIADRFNGLPTTPNCGQF
jgi:hypothetical protein